MDSPAHVWDEIAYDAQARLSSQKRQRREGCDQRVQTMGTGFVNSEKPRVNRLLDVTLSKLEIYSTKRPFGIISFYGWTRGAVVEQCKIAVDTRSGTSLLNCWENTALFFPKSIQAAGCVAAVRFAFSLSKKPFHSYDFHKQLTDLIPAFLKLVGPESPEIPDCTCLTTFLDTP